MPENCPLRHSDYDGTPHTTPPRRAKLRRVGVSKQEAAMVEWAFKGREFTNCNCAYGCPCQFNALPTHGNCQAVIGIQIDEGHHGQTSLDGLRFAGVFA